MNKPTTVAVVQPKGGGTKSAVVANLAGALSERGCKVLVVDLDRQGTVSYNFGFYEPLELDPKPSAGLCHALLERQTIRQFVRPTMFAGIEIVPNGHGFAEFDAELERKRRANAHTLVHDALGDIGEGKDIILLDTRGTLDWSTINAIAAADRLLLPVIPDTPNINELPLAFAEIDEVVRDCELSAPAQNLVVTRFVGRTSLHAQMVEQLRETYGSAVLETVIRNSISVSECHAHQKPVVFSEPRSNGAQDYRALAVEFETKCLRESERRVVNA